MPDYEIILRLSDEDRELVTELVSLIDKLIQVDSEIIERTADASAALFALANRATEDEVDDI